MMMMIIAAMSVIVIVRWVRKKYSSLPYTKRKTQIKQLQENGIMNVQ